jgi:hypothetical protein
LSLATSDFDLTVSCSDDGELLGVTVGNILGFCATAVLPRPIQPMAITPSTNRIFMENLCFIGFDKIKGVETKVWHT